MAASQATTTEELFDTTQTPDAPDTALSPGDLPDHGDETELFETVTPSDATVEEPDPTPTEADYEEARDALEAGFETVHALDKRFDRLDMMGTVRVLGGSMIGIAILVVVLNEVFGLSQISNSSGPFADVISQLESTGGAALGLLVIGLLVLGANRVMGFFGGGGF